MTGVAKMPTEKLIVPMHDITLTLDNDTAHQVWHALYGYLSGDTIGCVKEELMENHVDKLHNVREELQKQLGLDS